MKKKVVLAGGSGFLGKELYTHFLAKGYEPTILSRSPQKLENYKTVAWNPLKGELPTELLSTASIIMNLSGVNVGGKRWSNSFKESLFNSRIESTRALVTYLNNSENNLDVFVNASATGFYGFDRGEEELDENSDPGNDFFGELCFEWEKEAMKLERGDLKIIRTGVVLDTNEGAFPKLKAPVLAGIGSALGSGKQYFPWVHLYDVLNAVTHIVETSSEHKIFNIVAPNQETNKSFTRKLANSLNKQLFMPNVPGFVLKLMVGEFANSILGSLKVQPKQLLETGYEFIYPDAKSALKELNWGRKQ